MDDQLSIMPRPKPAPHRVRALAGTLAGFGWPGRQTFEKLTPGQQAVTLETAELALERIEAAAEAKP